MGVPERRARPWVPAGRCCGAAERGRGLLPARPPAAAIPALPALCRCPAALLRAAGGAGARGDGVKLEKEDKRRVNL